MVKQYYKLAIFDRLLRWFLSGGSFFSKGKEVNRKCQKISKQTCIRCIVTKGKKDT